MGFCFASLGISLVYRVAGSTILGRSQFETTMATFEFVACGADENNLEDIFVHTLHRRLVEFVLDVNLKFMNCFGFKVNFAFNGILSGR